MSSLRVARRALGLGLVGWALTLGNSALAAGREIVAVNARVFNDYSRVTLPDGSFKPERYTFGEGGRWDAGARDPSIDQLSFVEIAKTLAGPLRAQGFVPSVNSEETELLILVFWGATAGTDGGGHRNTMATAMDAMRNSAAAAAAVPADEIRGTANSSGIAASDAAQSELDSALMLNELGNQLRDKENLANARILGYTEAYARALSFESIGQPTLARSIVPELEENRYFVVLKAYDFGHARREKKLRLLWETRFSIRQAKNRFDEELLGMAQYASRHFGQNTGGLIRRDLPDVKVEIGTPTVVELPADAKK